MGIGRDVRCEMDEKSEVRGWQPPSGLRSALGIESGKLIVVWQKSCEYQGRQEAPFRVDAATLRSTFNRREGPANEKERERVRVH